MDFKALYNLLSESESVMVFGHINPDGDSIGAMLAMAAILEKMGKSNVRLYSRDGVPDFLHFLPGAEKISDKNGANGARPAQLALLVDCGGPKRAGEDFVPLIESCPKLAVIDHHVTNSGFGHVNVTDPGASSTCEIITLFALDSGIEIDRALAVCLYTGMMYDTGRFMHSNTTTKVFRLCADLASLGADPSRIAAEVFRNRSISSLRLLGYALNNIQTDMDGAICWSVIERSVYHELGAKDEDAEGIVEQLGAYRGCEVHAVFGQAEDGRTRVSMRSSGRVNVGRICAKFGGGGHDFAAGLRSKEPLDTVTAKVLGEIRAAVRELEK
jgi:bifunctional oligoribonuclease and PAP phosphatase NrnA